LLTFRKYAVKAQTPRKGAGAGPGSGPLLENTQVSDPWPQEMFQLQKMIDN